MCCCVRRLMPGHVEGRAEQNKGWTLTRSRANNRNSSSCRQPSAPPKAVTAACAADTSANDPLRQRQYIHCSDQHLIPDQADQLSGRIQTASLCRSNQQGQGCFESTMPIELALMALDLGGSCHPGRRLLMIMYIWYTASSTCSKRESEIYWIFIHRNISPCCVLAAFCK